MRKLLLGIALLLPMTGVASASFVVDGNTVKLAAADHSTNGGAFTASFYDKNTSSEVKGTFKTFCVELTQHFTPGAEYKVKLSDRVTSIPGDDGKLTEQAASLYRLFLDAVNPTHQFEDQIQYGIWRAMGYEHGEITTHSSSVGINSNKTWYEDWASTIFEHDANWVNVYDVLIMQLTDSNGNGEFQDQLVWIPTPDATAATPEPTTFAIWGGLATLGLAVRACRRQG